MVTSHYHSQLMAHSVAVILDNEADNKFIGLLTKEDLVKPCNLVIDCISHKPTLEIDANMRAALDA